MTGKSTIIVIPGKAGHLPDVIRFVRWYDDGVPDFLEHYSDGQLNGVRTDWDASGRMVEHNQYVMGEKHGKSIKFHLNYKTRPGAEVHWEHGTPVSVVSIPSPWVDAPAGEVALPATGADAPAGEVPVPADQQR